MQCRVKAKRCHEHMYSNDVVLFAGFVLRHLLCGPYLCLPLKIQFAD